jgi:hypothetical protein
MIVCDRDGCEAIADYLEVEDDGTEQRLCASHTRSYKLRPNAQNVGNFCCTRLHTPDNIKVEQNRCSD